MQNFKKIFSILAVIIISIVLFYFSDYEVVESGTVLKRDTVKIETSRIENMETSTKEKYK